MEEDEQGETSSNAITINHDKGPELIPSGLFFALILPAFSFLWFFPSHHAIP
jgi:hypothetical protein